MTTYSLIRAQDLVMPMSTLYFLIFLWQLKIPMKDIESDEPPQINNKPNFDTEAINLLPGSDCRDLCLALD